MAAGGSKGNILYVSYDGMTDPLGQSQVIPYLAGLSKRGYAFTLISFEKPDRFKKSSKEIAALLKANNIDWVPLAYTKSPPVLSTLYDLWHMQKTAFALHKKKQFVMVHCRSYLSALLGLKMKMKFAVPFIFDMRGFYADERVDGDIWNLANPLYRFIYNFFKQKEKEFLTHAAHTISLTRKAKDIIHTWRQISGQPVPIQVIPCCSDLALFSPKNIDVTLKQQLVNKFSLLQADFVLSYLGSIGSWYLLDEMLDFFKCLLHKKPNARFLFITADAAADIVAKAAERGIPAQAIIISPARRNEVPTYLSLSNWSIFFIKPVFSKSASSPTKQGEIMGMGIPHICNAGVGDVGDVVNTEKIGLLVNLSPDKDYTAIVDKMLAANPDHEEIMKRAGQEFSLIEGVTRYAAVYAQVLNSANAPL